MIPPYVIIRGEGNMETKICSRCKQEKTIGEFYKHNRDGYRSRCKSCQGEDSKEYFRRPEVKERTKSYYRKYDKDYRKRPYVMVKDFARSYLNHAIQAGRVNREPCSMCGKEQAEGHHEDYYQPLLIVWLCPPCHQATHRLDKENAIPSLINT